MSLEEIVQSPYFAMSSFIIAVLGFFAAYFFFRRSKRERKPYYAVSQRAVIENKKPSLPGLSIYFHGTEQETITVANVAFWNRGRETIRDVDVAAADKLRIVVAENTDVLDARILTTCDDANQCKIGKPEKDADSRTSIPVEFDYLDQNEGLLVQIVHNGSHSHRIKVDGKVKGAPTILHDDSDRIFSSSRFPFPFQHVSRDALRPMGGLMSLMGFLGGVGFVVMGILEKKWTSFAWAVFLFLAGWGYYSMFFRTLIPKKLQKDL